MEVFISTESDKDIYQQLIINALKTMKSAKVSDIKAVLERTKDMN